MISIGQQILRLFIYILIFFHVEYVYTTIIHYFDRQTSLMESQTMLNRQNLTKVKKPKSHSRIRATSSRKKLYLA